LRVCVVVPRRGVRGLVGGVVRAVGLGVVGRVVGRVHLCVVRRVVSRVHLSVVTGVLGRVVRGVLGSVVCLVRLGVLRRVHVGVVTRVLSSVVGLVDLGVVSRVVGRVHLSVVAGVVGSVVCRVHLGVVCRVVRGVDLGVIGRVVGCVVRLVLGDDGQRCRRGVAVGGGRLDLVVLALRGAGGNGQVGGEVAVRVGGHGDRVTDRRSGGVLQLHGHLGGGREVRAVHRGALSRRDAVGIGHDRGSVGHPERRLRGDVPSGGADHDVGANHRP